jgi:hypothetical protein
LQSNAESRTSCLQIRRRGSLKNLPMNEKTSGLFRCADCQAWDAHCAMEQKLRRLTLNCFRAGRELNSIFGDGSSQRAANRCLVLLGAGIT